MTRLLILLLRCYIAAAAADVIRAAIGWRIWHWAVTSFSQPSAKESAFSGCSVLLLRRENNDSRRSARSSFIKLMFARFFCPLRAPVISCFIRCFTLFYKLLDNRFAIYTYFCITYIGGKCYVIARGQHVHLNKLGGCLLPWKVEYLCLSFLIYRFKNSHEVYKNLNKWTLYNVGLIQIYIC